MYCVFQAEKAATDLRKVGFAGAWGSIQQNSTPGPHLAVGKEVKGLILLLAKM